VTNIRDLVWHRLDYVGPADFVHRVAKKVRHVTLLDHHKTAFELMEQWKSENSLPENCTPSRSLSPSPHVWCVRCVRCVRAVCPCGVSVCAVCVTELKDMAVDWVGTTEKKK
jgi:hypothetical protein